MLSLKYFFLHICKQPLLSSSIDTSFVFVRFLSKYPEGTEGTIINLHEVAKELSKYCSKDALSFNDIVVYFDRYTL